MSESDSLIAFARDLVRTRSVLGGEGEVAKRVVDEMLRLDFSRADIDTVGNALGVVEG